MPTSKETSWRTIFPNWIAHVLAWHPRLPPPPPGGGGVWYVCLHLIQLPLFDVIKCIILKCYLRKPVCPLASMKHSKLLEMQPMVPLQNLGLQTKPWHEHKILPKQLPVSDKALPMRRKNHSGICEGTAPAIAPACASY